MRVALVGPTYPHRGGIVHYTNSLARALDEVPGTDVSVHSFSRFFPRLLYKGGAYEGETGIALPPRIPVQRAFTYGNPLSWRRGARLMERPDVAHFQYWTPFLAPAFHAIARRCQRQGARVVATIHNVQPHEPRDRALSFLGRRFLRAADAVIVHAEGMRAQAAAQFRLDERRVHVVPQGVYEHLNRHAVGRDEARARLGFREDDRVALMFGIVRRYKGLDVALRALAKLPPRHKLLVVGECWEDWEPYARLIRELGLEERVTTILRYVDDPEIETFFRAADVAVFPYRRFEAQSAAALTALAFEAPIVVSDVGGLPLLAPPHLRVPPEDADALAKVLADDATYRPRTDEGNASFRWPAIARRTRALYEELSA